jgi:hypothetical protein
MLNGCQFFVIRMFRASALFMKLYLYNLELNLLLQGKGEYTDRYKISLTNNILIGIFMKNC